MTEAVTIDFTLGSRRLLAVPRRRAVHALTLTAASTTCSERFDRAPREVRGRGPSRARGGFLDRSGGGGRRFNDR